MQKEKKILIYLEPKDKLNCKAQISYIDWSVDGRLVCVSIKHENIVVIWNISTCKKVYLFKAAEHNFGNINRAVFYCLSPDYVLISGDKAIIVKISTNEIVMMCDNFTI